MGRITVTETRSEAVDFSIPYSEEKIGLISHIPFALPKWSAIFWPFTIEVWISIVLSCLLFGPGLYAFLKLIDDGSAFDLQSCIFEASKSLLLQCELSFILSLKDHTKMPYSYFISALSKWPSKMPAKIMLLFWCFYTMVIVIGKLNKSSSKLKENPLNLYLLINLFIAYSGNLISSLT